MTQKSQPLLNSHGVHTGLTFIRHGCIASADPAAPCIRGVWRIEMSSRCTPYGVLLCMTRWSVEQGRAARCIYTCNVMLWPAFCGSNTSCEVVVMSKMRRGRSEHRTRRRGRYDSRSTYNRTGTRLESCSQIAAVRSKSTYNFIQHG